jgi:hypothetical protein
VNKVGLVGDDPGYWTSFDASFEYALSFPAASTDVTTK